jgi:hypothetical protein
MWKEAPMKLTTIARGLVAGLRSVCGLCVVLAMTAAAVQAGGPTHPTSVPEIDPGSISGALAMLASGAFLIKGRLRRK